MPVTEQQLHQDHGNAVVSPQTVPGQQLVPQPAQPPQVVNVVGNKNQPLTIINKFYYNIMGFPEAKEDAGHKSWWSYIQSHWLQMLILLLVVMILIVLVTVVISNDKPVLNDWEMVGKIAGSTVRGFLKIIGIPIE